MGLQLRTMNALVSFLMCEFIDVFAAALLEKMTLTTANTLDVSTQFVLSNNLASCCFCEHDFFYSGLICRIYIQHVIFMSFALFNGHAGKRK